MILNSTGSQLEPQAIHCPKQLHKIGPTKANAALPGVDSDETLASGLDVCCAIFATCSYATMSGFSNTQ